MKPNLSYLAKYLGVSEATVSLAMNNRPGVSEKTRKKVLGAAELLGYVPNYFASSLASQKSNTIGLIIPEIDNPYYSSLTQKIEGIVRESDYKLIIGFSGQSLESEEETIKRFLAMKMEGIIIAPMYQYQTTNSYKNLVQKSSVPIIYLGAHYDFNWNYIMTDLAEGSFLLTDHILSKGYKSIMFLSGDEEIIIAREREKGFKKAHAKRGLSVSENQLIRCELFNFHEAYKKTLLLLDENEPFDAIISINDIMALGTMRALKENGINIPRDLAVAGYDNVIYSQIAETSLTTVSQPIDELAKLSVVNLFKIISKEETDEYIQIEIPPKLIIRDST